MMDFDFKKTSNPEEAIYFLQKLIWYFFQGEKNFEKNSEILDSKIKEEVYPSENINLLKQRSSCISRSINNPRKENYYFFISKRFFTSIKKYFFLLKFFRFNQNQKLKIFFGEFLIEFCNKNNLVIEQLESIDKTKLSLIEEFILKRLENDIKTTQSQKRTSMMEDKIVLEELIWIEREQKINTQMQSLIEIAVNSNVRALEFLREDIVDFKKFNISLKIVNESIERCHEFWNKTPQINEMNFECKLHYGIFLRDILNLKIAGERIVKNYYSIKRREILKYRNIMEIKFREAEKTFELNSNPLCLLHKTSKRIIKIKECNMEFSRLIGMTRNYLRGKNLVEIVGKYTNKFYDKLMYRDDLSSKKEQFKLSFKYGDKWIKILSAEVRVIRQGEEESFAIVLVSLSSSFRAEGNILINKNGKIYGFDSGCLNILGIENFEKKMKNFKNIKDIVKNFKFEFPKNILILKNGTKINGELSKMSDSDLYLLKLIKVKDNFTFMRHGLEFSKTLEIKEKKKREKLLESFDVKSKIFSKKFKFKINSKLNFEGKFYSLKPETELQRRSTELVSRTEEEKEDEKNLYKIINHYLRGLESKEVERKIDYGKNIRIKRLVDGHIRDVNDFTEDEFSENFEEEKNFKTEKLKIKSIIGGKKSRRSRQLSTKIMANLGGREGEKVQKSLKISQLRNLKQKLKVNHYKLMKSQKYFILLNILVTIGILSTEYVINQTETLYLKRVELLNKISNTAGLRNAAVLNICHRLHDLFLVNQGFDFTAAYDENYTTELFAQENIDFIRYYFKDFEKYQNILFNLYASFHDKTQIEEMETEKYIEIISEGKSKFYNYWDAMNILYSSTADVMRMKPEEITKDNKEAFFLFRNILNPLLIRFVKANQIRFREIEVLTIESNELHDLSIKILIVKSVFIFLFMTLLINWIYRDIQKYMKIFLGFNRDYLKRVLKTNLIFVKKIQKQYYEQEDDEFFDDFKNDIDIDEDSEEDEMEIQNMIMKRKIGRRKRTKGSIVPFFGFLKISFFFFILSDILISEENYRRNNELVNKGLGFAVSFRTILIIDSVLKLVNILTDMTLYEENFAFFKNPANAYLKSFDPYSHQLNNTMNYNLDDDLRKSYDKYLYSNVCEYFEEMQIPVEQFKIDCNKFFNGWPQQSFFESLLRYDDRIDDMISKMKFVYANKNLEKFPFKNKCLEKYKKKINGSYKFNWCLLTSKENLEISNIIILNFFQELFHQRISKPITSILNEAGKKAVNLKINEGFSQIENEFILKVIILVLWSIFVAGVTYNFKKEIYGIKAMIFYQREEELLHNQEFIEFFAFENFLIND